MEIDSRIKLCPNPNCSCNIMGKRFGSSFKFCSECGYRLIYVCAKCLSPIEDIGPAYCLCSSCYDTREAQKAGRAANMRFLGSKFSDNIRSISNSEGFRNIASSATVGAKNLGASVRSMSSLIIDAADVAGSHLDATVRNFGGSLSKKLDSWLDNSMIESNYAIIEEIRESPVYVARSDSELFKLPFDYKKHFDSGSKFIDQYKGVYAKETGYADIFVLCYESDRMSNFFSADKAELAASLHSCCSDDECLLEVGNGHCASGNRYYYAIKKSKHVSTTSRLECSDYIMTLDILKDGTKFTIWGFFDCRGIAGSRENTVLRNRYNELSKRGTVTSTQDLLSSGWYFDPYESDRTSGYLMNVSEKAEYDSMFPEYPLSQARSLINYIITNN